MTDEATLRENVLMLENARAQLDALAKQQQLIQLAIEEHVRARETIKSLGEASPGDEVLVPVGADSYIHARVSDDRSAIVGIGSSVSIKRTPQEAEKILDAKIDELTQAFKKVAERAAQTEGAVEELTAKIQDAYGQMRAGGEG